MIPNLLLQFTGLLAVALSGCAEPSGLSKATAVVGENDITITIPMGDDVWGAPATLCEDAGRAMAKALSSHSGERFPSRSYGAFGVVVARDGPEDYIKDDQWALDYVIWAPEDLDDDRYLLLDTFVGPCDEIHGIPRTARARSLYEQLRRVHLAQGNIVVPVAADQEEIVIRDSGLLFEHVKRNGIRSVLIYVTLCDGSRSRVFSESIPVQDLGSDAPGAGIYIWH
jgi:hypothetical protein